MNPEDVASLQNEVAILGKLNHPCILQLLAAYEDSQYYYMVTDRLYGGELFERIVQKTQYGEGDARDLVKVVLETIAYLHQHDIVHRDLKPENLLLCSPHDDNDIKLADFGLACKAAAGSPLLTKFCGSPDYVAPEIIARKPYGKPVDIWSLGVITYILLCGYPPFQGQSNSDLFASISSGSYSFPREDWSGISQVAKMFIRECALVVDPTRRWTAKRLLRHPWYAV